VWKTGAALPLPKFRPIGARVASRIALPSTIGEKSLAELDAAKQHRTIHLLSNPDILTCYQHVP
jgi:hypothetical protein